MKERPIVISTTFKDIQFTPQYHTYRLKGRRLTAVTKFTAQFIPEFDHDYWSAKKAEERGIPQAEILAEWAAKGKASREKGTVIHEHIAAILNDTEAPPQPDPFLALNESDLPPECDTFNLLWQSQLSLLARVWQTEWVIGDEALGLAGTVDTVLAYPETSLYHIFDWKSNERFTTHNAWGKKLLPPFDDLDDCDLTKYSLQVSTYKLILRRNTGLTLGDSYIVHLRPTNYKIHQALDLGDRLEAFKA